MRPIHTTFPTDCLGDIDRPYSQREVPARSGSSARRGGKTGLNLPPSESRSLRLGSYPEVVGRCEPPIPTRRLIDSSCVTRLVLHVGYPKAGSTTLQELVFAKHPGVRNLGKPLDRCTPALKQVLHRIRDDTDAAFDGAACAALAAGVIGVGDDRATVISYEDLTWAVHAKRAARARATFGPATILLIVRQQIAWLQSVYLHEAKRRAVPSFREWLGLQRAEPHGGAIASARYLDVIETYRRAFAPGKVHVIPLELLRFDPQRFAERLGSACGIDAGPIPALIGDRRMNRAPSSLAYRLSRAAHAVSPSLRATVMRRAGRAVRLVRRAVRGVSAPARVDTADVAEELFEEYRGTNRQLCDLLEMDLAPLGYGC